MLVAGLVEPGGGGLVESAGISAPGKAFREARRALGKGVVVQGLADPDGVGCCVGMGGFGLDVEFAVTAFADKEGTEEGLPITQDAGGGFLEVPFGGSCPRIAGTGGGVMSVSCRIYQCPAVSIGGWNCMDTASV